MTRREVVTQDELDAALADTSVTLIIIRNGGGWLRLSGSHSATVEAWGSATVEASGSATVRASGSATVEAWGSATVEAWGSATVRAWGSATVRAWGSATVEATPWVAVHQHSPRAAITGGMVIDHSAIRLDNPDTWCRYHGVEVTDGIATVYKAANAAWTTDRGTDYTPGTTPTAPDWQPDPECGHGLHFSPTPAQAAGYLGEPAVHYLAVGVEVATLVPLGADKCKAPRVVRACVEVDRAGRPVVAS